MADHEEENSRRAARVGLTRGAATRGRRPALPAGMNRERREKRRGKPFAVPAFEMGAGEGDMANDAGPFLGEPFADDATRRAQGVEESCDVLGREGCIDDPSRDGMIAGLGGAENDPHSRGIVFCRVRRNAFPPVASMR